MEFVFNTEWFYSCNLPHVQHCSFGTFSIGTKHWTLIICVLPFKIIAFSRDPMRCQWATVNFTTTGVTTLTPSAAWEAFFLPLCCYSSQPTSKVRTPKARVVRALCLLSMCVIARSEGAERAVSCERECLSTWWLQRTTGQTRRTYAALPPAVSRGSDRSQVCHLWEVKTDVLR